MDQQRSVHTIGDETLDREIVSTLAVDPSPEFLARVRTRIAAEQAASTWSIPWPLASAVISIAVVALAIVITWQRHEPPVVSSALSAPAAETSPRVGQAQRLPAEGAPVVAPVVGPKAVRTRSRAQAATGGTTPEVLISEEEAGALRHLFTDINERRIETSFLPSGSPSGPLMPIGEIVIDPIIVNPLKPIGGA